MRHAFQRQQVSAGIAAEGGRAVVLDCRHHLELIEA
jgi:hypothetical protein